jgi:hypothetical protein
MNPASVPAPVPTPQPSATASALVCERCGRFDSREIGTARLCDECYCEAGACCAADDDDSPSGTC